MGYTVRVMKSNAGAPWNTRKYSRRSCSSCFSFGRVSMKTFNSIAFKAENMKFQRPKLHRFGEGECSYLNRSTRKHKPVTSDESKITCKTCLYLGTKRR